jgi:chloride channel 3/4/5
MGVVAEEAQTGDGRLVAHDHPARPPLGLSASLPLRSIDRPPFTSSTTPPTRIRLARRVTAPDHIDSMSDAPFGPLSGPSNTAWRRQRLLRIGSRSSIVHEESPAPESSPSVSPTAETSPLLGQPGLARTHSASAYGSTASRLSFRVRHNLPALPSLRLSSSKSISSPPSPSNANRASPTLERARSSLLRFAAVQRPISAYDASYAEHKLDADDDSPSPSPAPDAQTNGIRVWYSSFSSIDWLHDAIKDADRHYRLRRRKSLRGRARNAADRAMGWVIVTIVGFLTAIVAWAIVRAEQWLFDFKEGYCAGAWHKSKRMCCPEHADLHLRPASLGFVAFEAAAQPCAAWHEWGVVLTSANASGAAREWTQYATYALVALLLAGLSAALTIGLTASTSFVTRKDSGVLAGDFAGTDEGAAKHAHRQPEGGKRQVMYYASGSGIPEIKTILSGARTASCLWLLS